MIELMIVVAIVGILAVLAIYGVRKYLANAKTAEARNSLGQIAKDEATAFERESMTSAVLPTGSSAAMSRKICDGEPGGMTVPALPSQIQGKKYQSSPFDWTQGAATNQGFACIKFSMDQPQYYVYALGASSSPIPPGVGAPVAPGCGTPGCSFESYAFGDLNGDGTLSTFALSGTVNNQLALDIAPNLFESQPEE